MRCKICGGTCVEKDGGYECLYCSAKFSKADFAPKPAPAPKAAPAPAPAPAPAASYETHSNETGADVFETCCNGVCEVFTQFGTGSGYLVSFSGYCITNSHVVSRDDGSSCGECKVKVAGETVSATVVAMGTCQNSEHCSNKDLAVLKLMRVPAGAKPLKFGDYSHVRTGENIYVIGNSLGCGTLITGGIVSDKNRNGQLMYDCATNPGNSGGPVFNADGRVIGTHVAGTSPSGMKVQGMNIAIPSTYAVQLLERLNISLF